MANIVRKPKISNISITVNATIFIYLQLSNKPATRASMNITQSNSITTSIVLLD